MDKDQIESWRNLLLRDYAADDGITDPINRTQLNALCDLALLALYLAPAHGEREPLKVSALLRARESGIAEGLERAAKWAKDEAERLHEESQLWRPGITQGLLFARKNELLKFAEALAPAKQPDAEGGASPEIREAGGRLDEVVAKNCFFHLEQMSDTHWWMAVTSGGVCVHINLSSKAKIIANAESEPEALPAVPEKKS